MKLYLKLHPVYLAYLLDDDRHAVIPVGRDIFESADRIRNELFNYNDIDIAVAEKPFLMMLNNDDQEKRRQHARDTIRIQRLFGIITWEFYKLGIKTEHVSVLKARQAVYHTTVLDMDNQLSVTRALLPDTKLMPALPVLCLHDCLVLRRYYAEYEKNHDNI